MGVFKLTDFGCSRRTNDVKSMIKQKKKDVSRFVGLVCRTFGYLCQYDRHSIIRLTSNAVQHKTAHRLIEQLNPQTLRLEKKPSITTAAGLVEKIRAIVDQTKALKSDWKRDKKCQNPDCTAGNPTFGWFKNRRHHCRRCGKSICGACSGKRTFPYDTKASIVCQPCIAKYWSRRRLLQ